MKIVFVGDSLVSCTNVALAATWPEIAAKKLGFTAVNHAAGGRLTSLCGGCFAAMPWQKPRTASLFNAASMMFCLMNPWKR